MLCFPNAKINLGLNIVRKRDDGYHDIETIFYPIGLCDALEIVPFYGDRTESLLFTPSGIDVGGDIDKNLAVKAYHLLSQYCHLPKVDMFLHKHIPFGAGLGGGSSDAAFALKMLNELSDARLSEKQLEDIASKLGADCPFFIQNKPVFASGIGNVFEPIDFCLQDYYLVLIKPDIFVSTPEAYARVKPSVPDVSLKDIIQMPIKEWKDKMLNNFELSVFSKFPAINEIKNNLYNVGAVYASMSGSGSSVFGIFDSLPEGVEELFSNCFVWKGQLKSNF